MEARPETMQNPRCDSQHRRLLQKAAPFHYKMQQKILDYAITCTGGQDLHNIGQ